MRHRLSTYPVRPCKDVCFRFCARYCHGCPVAPCAIDFTIAPNEHWKKLDTRARRWLDNSAQGETNDE